jgi:hypothetical protein
LRLLSPQRPYGKNTPISLRTSIANDHLFRAGPVVTTTPAFEIEKGLAFAIVENLFIGNKLEQSEIRIVN